MEDEIDPREQAFHSTVRHYIVSAQRMKKNDNCCIYSFQICWLLFIALYGCSYLIIRKFKKRSDADDLYAGEFSLRFFAKKFLDYLLRAIILNHLGDAEDYLVYRISLWICTFSMAVSIAAVLLLPFSIFGNEIALAYPNSYYFRWLNGTLIHGKILYLGESFLFSKQNFQDFGITYSFFPMFAFSFSCHLLIFSLNRKGFPD